MSRQFIFLDPLEKLTIKKDSTLMLALTFKSRGHECYLVFEEDLAYTNTELPTLKAYGFEGQFEDESCYLKDFHLGTGEEIKLRPGDVFHMRLDPPFDNRYLRYLWLLGGLEKQGVKVVNKPSGVLTVNEKICAYENPSSLESFIGLGAKALEDFSKNIEADEFILKPLDLFQGIGVEKVERANLLMAFKRKVKELDGPIIVQPFWSEIKNGEIRSVYYQGKELGTILKTPPKDEYLANIAQGAKYKAYELKENERKVCEDVSRELLGQGIDWVAFDLFADKLSEVNVTCPGLIVEVSEAMGRNLCVDIVKSFE